MRSQQEVIGLVTEARAFPAHLHQDVTSASRHTPQPMLPRAFSAFCRSELLAPFRYATRYPSGLRSITSKSAVARLFARRPDHKAPTIATPALAFGPWLHVVVCCTSDTRPLFDGVNFRVGNCRLFTCLTRAPSIPTTHATGCRLSRPMPCRPARTMQPRMAACVGPERQQKIARAFHRRSRGAGLTRTAWGSRLSPCPTQQGVLIAQKMLMFSLLGI
jgi:hypothetical protein